MGNLSNLTSTTTMEQVNGTTTPLNLEPLNFISLHFDDWSIQLFAMVFIPVASFAVIGIIGMLAICYYSNDTRTMGRRVFHRVSNAMTNLRPIRHEPPTLWTEEDDDLAGLTTNDIFGSASTVRNNDLSMPVPGRL